MHLGCIRTLAIGSKDPEGGGGVASPPPEGAANSPMMSAGSVCIVSSSGRCELLFQRKLPDAFAGRREDRIGQSGPRHRRARFADSPGSFQVAYQVDLDGGRFVYP